LKVDGVFVEHPDEATRVIERMLSADHTPGHQNLASGMVDQSLADAPEDMVMPGECMKEATRTSLEMEVTWSAYIPGWLKKPIAQQ